MPRLHRSWAALGLSAALLLASCSGGDDPTTPVQGSVTAGTYFHATITLLDTGPACVPSVACTPEFLDCSGTTGFFVGETWTFDADEATAGALSYTGASQVPQPNGVFVVRGSDLDSDIGLSLGFRVVVDPPTGTWAVDMPASGAERVYVNLDQRCTVVDGNLDGILLFGSLAAPAPSTTLSSLPLTPQGDVDFAVRDRSGLDGGIIEGTFTFRGQLSQEFGILYQPNVVVTGCFRVPLPQTEQDVALDPAAAPGC